MPTPESIRHVDDQTVFDNKSDFDNKTDLDVLYEDEWFAVINKAANFLSVPGKGADKQDCVVTRAANLFGEAHAVHRLDYATSGLLLIAKNSDSHRLLSSHFRNREIIKEYRAVVRGHVIGEQGQLCKPLICDWPNRPKQIIHVEWGKKAITQWQALERIVTPEEKQQTRLALFPITGRSHQLRVHMQSINHAIVGDEFYDDQLTKTDQRLKLHAYRLEFSHPITQAWVKFVAICPF